MPLKENKVVPLIVEPPGEEEAELSAPANQQESDSPKQMQPPMIMPKSKQKQKAAKNAGLLGADLALVKGPQTGSHFKRDLPDEDRGRPMMDWIRRQSMAPPDPHSNDSSRREITYEELSQHNRHGDYWLALRGQVFDVTHYVKFHPGGVSEILKGVGKDATALFNSIHRYVNFETILKGCRVGMYVPGGTIIAENIYQPDEVPGNDNNGFPERKCWGCKICALCKENNDKYGEPLPYTRFREDENNVFYEVELRGLKYTEDYWTVGIVGLDEIFLKVITKPPELWVANYRLKEALIDDTIEVSFANRAKRMTVKLVKPRKLQWKSIGRPLLHCNLIEDSRCTVDDMYKAMVIARSKLAHNIYFFAIELHPSARIGTPIGYDVKISVEGHSRRYTPICLLLPNSTPTAPTNPASQVLYFIIKVYEDGQLTPLLLDLPLATEDRLLIGSVRGDFNTDFLVGADMFFLLAAGSGITPHIRIIKYFVEHNIAIGASNVILIHWSKEEQDLVWKSGLEKMTKEISWFNYLPVLTQCPPDDPWPGLRGRISEDLVKRMLNHLRIPVTKKKRVRFITCGTDGFNCTVCETIQAMGYPLESTFIFQG